MVRRQIHAESRKDVPDEAADGDAKALRWELESASSPLDRRKKNIGVGLGLDR